MQIMAGAALAAPVAPRGTFTAAAHLMVRTAARSLAVSKGRHMLATLAVVLVVLWLLGFFAFHITSAAIHVALVIAVVLVVLHFVRGRRSI